MSTRLPDQHEVLDAIRTAANSVGHPPSRQEFMRASGMTEYQVLKHFPSWREAIRAAGLDPHTSNLPIDTEKLLEDWGGLVRRARRIPTIDQYRRDGTYSPSVFARKFGPWSGLPSKFRDYALDKPEWTDVVALLPIESPRFSVLESGAVSNPQTNALESASENLRHSKLDGRPTYGNPIDFRGLRHEPVNEQGVVFLFGMIARELGYHVEAVQTGFPDCEAKRQIDPGKWQRVRIEFEFASRNFRDHGHPVDGCDVIVCWRHNWTECPQYLEVVELSTLIRTLSASDD